MTELTVKERVIRAKTHMIDKFPFFSYLVLHLNGGGEIKQDTEIETACIDPYGNMSYNPDWFNKLPDEEIKGVLVHEVLHPAFSHLGRLGNKIPGLWNLSCDIVINNMLVMSGLSLPEGGAIPYNNKIELFGGEIIVEEIDKKYAEQIYAELYEKLDKKGRIGHVTIYGTGEGKNSKDKNNTRDGKYKDLPKSFDKHDHSSGGNKKSKDGKEESIEHIQEQWTERLVEASQHAKGNIPNGMRRLIDKLLNKKMNWRSLLQKYIVSNLKYDTTYKMPGKKSYATGIYMPSPLKENIEVIVAVDTSGSIGQNELTEFLTEIVNMGKSFNNITMHVIVADAEVHETYKVANGDIARIMAIACSGGGGTSHIPVTKFVADKHPHAKCLICLTDGYSDLPQAKTYLPFSCNMIIALTENGCDPKQFESFAKVVKISK